MTTKTGPASGPNTCVGGQNKTRGQPRRHAESPTGRDEFTAWLTASCQRQGLAVTITDPTLLAAIAALLR